MTTENNNSPEELTDSKPPYCSVPKFETGFGIVSKKSYPKLTPAIFQSYGIPKIEARLVFNAFKFLGAVKEDGTPTELMQKLRLTGDAQKEALKTMVRNGYDKLFVINDKPYEIPNDELTNDFISVYDLSKRLAASAVPLFKRLCEHAGFIERGSTYIRRVAPSSKISKPKSPTNTHTSTPQVQGGFSAVPVSGGKMTLNIPTEWQNELLTMADEELSTAWGNVMREAQKFVALKESKTNNEQKPAPKADAKME